MLKLISLLGKNLFFKQTLAPMLIQWKHCRLETSKRFEQLFNFRLNRILKKKSTVSQLTWNFCPKIHDAILEKKRLEEVTRDHHLFSIHDLIIVQKNGEKNPTFSFPKWKKALIIKQFGLTFDPCHSFSINLSKKMNFARHHEESFLFINMSHFWHRSRNARLCNFIFRKVLFTHDFYMLCSTNEHQMQSKLINKVWGKIVITSLFFGSWWYPGKHFHSIYVFTILFLKLN